MRSGRLRDRVTIQRDSSNPDSPEPDYTGAPLVTDWPCEIAAVKGYEKWRGRQIESHIDYVVTGRPRPGVMSSMRMSVTYGDFIGRVLNIESVRLVRGSQGLRQEHDCAELAEM